MKRALIAYFVVWFICMNLSHAEGESDPKLIVLLEVTEDNDVNRPEEQRLRLAFIIKNESNQPINFLSRSTDYGILLVEQEKVAKIDHHVIVDDVAPAALMTLYDRVTIQDNYISYLYFRRVFHFKFHKTTSAHILNQVDLIRFSLKQDVDPKFRVHIQEHFDIEMTNFHYVYEFDVNTNDNGEYIWGEGDGAGRVGIFPPSRSFIIESAFD